MIIELKLNTLLLLLILKLLLMNAAQFHIKLLVQQNKEIHIRIKKLSV